MVQNIDDVLTRGEALSGRVTTQYRSRYIVIVHCVPKKHVTTFSMIS